MMFSALKNMAKYGVKSKVFSAEMEVKWNVFSADVFTAKKYGETLKRFQRWCFQRWKIWQNTALSETFSALKTSIFSLGVLRSDFGAQSFSVVLTKWNRKSFFDYYIWWTPLFKVNNKCGQRVPLRMRAK